MGSPNIYVPERWLPKESSMSGDSGGRLSLVGEVWE